jgi:hypothetical protein
MTKVTFIFDDFAKPHWRPGRPPRTGLSHDYNLFQMAHEALRLGMTVHFTTIDDYFHYGSAVEATQIYPTLAIGTASIKLEALDPDILVSVHPQVFAGGQLQRAKKVGMHPALYIVEMPHTYGDHQTLALLQSVRYHVDHLVVQNERMRELAGAVYEWLCKWRAQDRVHVSPLGIVAEEQIDLRDRAVSRRVLGLRQDDIAIVNGGGVWRWTEVNNFLRGFCAAVRAGDTNLHFFLSGFKQTENTDHADYIAQTYAILRENIDLVGGADARAFVIDATPGQDSPRDAMDPGRGHIHFRAEWKAASRQLPEVLSAGDFGLNVSADTVENWQSHRVRCLDYIRYGLPIISTTGDLFSERDAAEVTLTVPGRTPAAFEAVLHRIAVGEVKAADLKGGFQLVRDRLDTRNTFGRLLLLVASTPRKLFDPNDESILEYAWRVRRVDSAAKILKNLTATAFAARD